MQEETKYRYWLKSVPGIGNKKIRKLVEYCGSAKEAYGLSRRQLLEADGIFEREADAILKSRNAFDLDREVAILEETGVSMVTLEEEAFPRRLLALSDCPYALFYKGTLPAEQKKSAAIVGARGCSSYGRAVGLALGEKLSACGVNIISGMAYGIDSFGHWGALRAGGKTYAVFGCGPDVCYPQSGRQLYEKIQEEGAILSEYPPKTKPAAGQFPARNRIISALSDVIIVVEAKKKSGSLITADFALEQGKEIYAVPGRMDDALSAGCNALIAQGGGIVLSADDLLAELGISPEKSTHPDIDEKKSLEKEESMVYSCFGLHSRSMEELLHMTGLSAPDLADCLVGLQKKGLLEEYYKNYYRIK